MHKSIMAGAAALLLLFVVILSGCHHPPVRHLASEACLITPNKTTRQEVLAYLGEPDRKREAAQGTEEWLYSQVNKSLLRKTPYVGHKLGYEEYDVLQVTFSGNIAVSCTYRSMDEASFKQGEEGSTR